MGDLIPITDPRVVMTPVEKLRRYFDAVNRRDPRGLAQDVLVELSRNPEIIPFLQAQGCEYTREVGTVLINLPDQTTHPAAMQISFTSAICLGYFFGAMIARAEARDE